ncbi:carboxymuconolactone decarboxylase family protein [uncultured Enterovirga sp.]|uniref:carboxymuconolactone decarboxylase family protein n=1 Tax=uncultured Enterovirga sp. TaxID=2026352 RepID=UPI0035C9E5D2
MTTSVFNETDAFRTGLSIRKTWLGEEHVERSLKAAEANPFTVPMQQIATESVWGQLWSRPGLELKERSLITLAILGALHMEEELQLHTGAALRNGLTEEQISEVLLHVALYAGVPRGIAAFRAARAVVEAGGAGSEASKADPAGGS